MSTELTVIERAAELLAFDETKAKVSALAAESARIVEITNTPGYQEAHAARVKLKFARIDIEKRGKAAREDAQDFCKAVIKKERELIEVISPEEDRLQALQDEWDATIAREKAAKAEAERLRVLNIRLAIDSVRGLPLLAVGATPAQIAELIDRAKAPLDIDAQEFDVEAKRAQQEAVDRLTAAHAAAVADEIRREEERKEREAEAARLAAERADLERLRAEQAAARAAQIEADIKAAAEREAIAAAERAKQAEELRMQRAAEEQARAERLAAEEADRKEREAKEATERAEQAEELRMQRAAEEQARAERLAAEEADRKEREAKEATERAERERLAAEAEAKRQAEDRRIAAEREQLARERAEQERVQRQREIDSATLYDAAIEAHALLTRLAPTSITTAKLGAAISRHAEPEALKAAA